MASLVLTTMNSVCRNRKALGSPLFFTSPAFTWLVQKYSCSWDPSCTFLRPTPRTAACHSALQADLERTTSALPWEFSGAASPLRTAGHQHVLLHWWLTTTKSHPKGRGGGGSSTALDPVAHLHRGLKLWGTIYTSEDTLKNSLV